MLPLFFLLALLSPAAAATREVWSLLYDPNVPEVRFAASEIRKSSPRLGVPGRIRTPNA
jgi:hypothetical protein